MIIETNIYIYIYNWLNIIKGKNNHVMVYILEILSKYIYFLILKIKFRYIKQKKPLIQNNLFKN
jgi:hypothetical protein